MPPWDSENPSLLRAASAHLAHEVANSLNGIFACLQLLDMKAQEQGLGDPELKSLLESAKAEIKRLGSLLKDFRAFSQPQRYDFEPTDLRKLIDDVIAEDRLLYESAGVRLKLDFPDVLLAIAVDPDKMKQAILRLCKNAVEAMPSGGLLTFRGYKSEGKVFLEIGDTGVGITNGSNVFEPFCTTKSLRSGLGLPIVSQIISAHKGTIDYVSELGKGRRSKSASPPEQFDTITPKGLKELRQRCRGGTSKDKSNSEVIYEITILRTLTLRSQDKACPGGKKDSLRTRRMRSQEQTQGASRTKSLRQSSRADRWRSRHLRIRDHQRIPGREIS